MKPAETLGAPPRCKEISIRRAATKRSFFSLQKNCKNRVFLEKILFYLGLVVRILVCFKLLLSNFIYFLADRGYLLLKKCCCVHQICLFLLNYCHTYLSKRRDNNFY